MYESKKINAPIAAQIMGFEHVENFDDLPPGFKMNWIDLADSGAFDNCEIIADYVKVYARYLLERMAEAKAARGD